MSTLLKSTVLSLGLLTGAAFAAQAQSGSVAALPPASAPAATAPSSGTYPGPNPGLGYYGTVDKQQAVQQSPAYVGPQPGNGYYGMPPAYQASAADQAPTSHPYTSDGMGPRPH